jgi:putative addiction module component (TIGR02574 family)
MNVGLRKLPIAERIQLVEDLWDSIADNQAALSLSDEQKAELVRRLDEYEINGKKGREAEIVMMEIRERL